MDMKKLKLIGTSHISKESTEKIKKCVEEFKPDVIALELDRGRFYALQQKEIDRKKGRKRSLSIRKIGVKGFLFALIGGYVTEKLAKKIGTKPGEDMLAAIALAKRENIRIVLIDQEIEKTLATFSKTLSWKERWRFVADIFSGLVLRKKEFYFDVKTIPDEDLIRTLLEKVKERYPNVYKALIEDRNVVMSRRLKIFMDREPEKKVLAVIGAGHEEGMMNILKGYEKD